MTPSSNHLVLKTSPSLPRAVDPLTSTTPTIMAASQDQSAGNSSTPKPTVTISSAHENIIHCIAWLPGDRIVSGSFDKTIRIWNLMDGAQEGTSMLHEEAVWQIVATKDGRIVSRCGRARHLIVWNADTQQLIDGPWSDEDHGPLENIALSHNEALLASCHTERIVFWEMAGTMRVRNFIQRDPFPGGVSDRAYATCLSPTGTRIAVSFGGRLSVVDVESGELILGPIGEDIVSVSWTHDGARILCGERLGNIHCFNSETGESVGEPWHLPGEVGYLSLSPDDKYLASGSFKGPIRFWDVKTNNPVGEPLSYGSPVSAISFSRTGEFFASGGYGGRILAWRFPWWDGEALNSRLDSDTSAVISPDAGGPTNVPDLDSLDVSAPRRPLPPHDCSIQNPSHDPARVQSSALSRVWWKRIPRFVFRRSYPIYPASGPSRLGVASSSTVDTNQRSHSRTRHTASGHSSEESSEGSSDTPLAGLEPEVGAAGCCGLWSRPRTRATADRARADAPIERSSRHPHPADSNNASLPASSSPAMQDILELPAVVRSANIP